jgi:hypothetical protein
MDARVRRIGRPPAHCVRCPPGGSSPSLGRRREGVSAGP